MNERLDLTELLKDCPKGTKFYSKCIGVVKFESIDNTLKRIIVKSEREIVFYKENGVYYYADEDAEIDLFPSKEQKDWSKWQRPFKDGDIITYMFYGKPTIYIYRKNGTHNTSYYAGYSSENNRFYDNATGALSGNRTNLRFATEEEKQILFDAIKSNGYKWNAKTKTLEKLIVPKFKVGDRIKHRLTGDVYKVVFILSNECDGVVYNVLTTNEIGKIIDIEEQDNYELLPNKFDPKTLKPFDKVLCRMNNDDIWGISLFERYAPTNPYPFFCIQDCFSQCVPYNDNTKHLVGTDNEAPEYYKCWED